MLSVPSFPANLACLPSQKRHSILSLSIAIITHKPAWPAAPPLSLTTTAHLSPTLTLKGSGGLGVAALVGMHHEGDLPVLPPHILGACIERQVQLLVGIELETP